MAENKNYKNKPYWELIENPDSLEKGLQFGDQGGFSHADYKGRGISGREPTLYDGGRPSSLQDSLEGRLNLAGYIGNVLDNGGFSGYLSALHAVEGLPVDSLDNPGSGSNSNRALYAVLAIYGARKLDDMADKTGKEYQLLDALVGYCVQNAGDLLKNYKK